MHSIRQAEREREREIKRKREHVLCVCVFVCLFFCLHLCVHVMSPLHRALLTGGLGAETKFIAEFSTDLKSSIEALRLWRRVSVRTLIYTSLPSLITSELRVGR